MEEKKIENLKEAIYEIINGIIDLRLSDEQLELLDYIYEIAEAEGLRNVMDTIEEYRIESNKCAKCGSGGLGVLCYEEDRGEYFGFPSREKIQSNKCNGCGWSDKYEYY
ncbi:MAG: hypothetical protein RR370_02660 [Synergistaceae bacterium]